MGTDAGVLEALASQALELARIAPAGWDGVLLVHCEDDVVEEAAHIDELVKVLVSIVAVAACISYVSCTYSVRIMVYSGVVLSGA